MSVHVQAYSVGSTTYPTFAVRVDGRPGNVYRARPRVGLGWTIERFDCGWYEVGHTTAPRTAEQAVRHTVEQIIDNFRKGRSS